jgi:hypothetical protein
MVHVTFTPPVCCRVTSNTLPRSGYPMYLTTERDGPCFFPFYPPPNPPNPLLLLLTPTPTPPPTGPPPSLLLALSKHKVTKLLRTFNYSATSHLTSHKSLNIELCCNYTLYYHLPTLHVPHALTSVIYISSFNECVSLSRFDSTSCLHPRHLPRRSVLRISSPPSPDTERELRASSTALATTESGLSRFILVGYPYHIPEAASVPTSIILQCLIPLQHIALVNTLVCCSPGPYTTPFTSLFWLRSVLSSTKHTSTHHHQTHERSGAYPAIRPLRL